jgi:hypothetical protein
MGNYGIFDKIFSTAGAPLLCAVPLIVTGKNRPMTTKGCKGKACKRALEDVRQRAECMDAALVAEEA